jgi:hypothetical protein
MDLPREIQVYIYSFLYDKWRIKWSTVMKSVMKIERKVQMLGCSSLWSTEWIGTKKTVKICMDCGEYYRIPMYSCQRISCSCD